MTSDSILYRIPLMEKTLAIIIIIITLVYGLYNAKKKALKPIITQSNYTKHIQEHSTSHYKEELKKLHTPAYLKQYIVDVINHGSNQLKFKPTEIMDAGFASKEDAPKIASYILALSGKKHTAYPKDAPMYYTSNCAGCHGEDAKGLNGTYPDLTREKLLGIAKREAYLKKMKKGH